MVHVIINKQWKPAKSPLFNVLPLKGSGVVTRRPLILQLVHTPPKKKTTTSKKSTKEEKSKGSEDDEEGEACKSYKALLHMLILFLV